MLCYIPREYMYLDILHVFYTYPKRVQDTFRIHIKYIKIHVSCALPSCHTGYMSGYIRIHVSWTLHHDTSGYTEIQNHDTCILDASCMTTLQDTIRIHHDTCILDASSEPRWIHTRYARDTLQIHSRYVSWARSICPAAQGAEVAPPLRRWSRAPLGARAEGLAPVPSDCSPP